MRKSKFSLLGTIYQIPDNTIFKLKLGMSFGKSRLPLTSGLLIFYYRFAKFIMSKLLTS